MESRSARWTAWTRSRCCSSRKAEGERRLCCDGSLERVRPSIRLQRRADSLGVRAARGTHVRRHFHRGHGTSNAAGGRARRRRGLCSDPVRCLRRHPRPPPAFRATSRCSRPPRESWGCGSPIPRSGGWSPRCDGRIVGSNFLDERDPIRGVGPITVDPESQNAGRGTQADGGRDRARRRSARHPAAARRVPHALALAL